MKLKEGLKEGFITQESDGEQIMVGVANTNFSGIVRSNKTAAFIIDLLKKETTKQDIIDTMLKNYDAPSDVIEKDVDNILKELRGIGAIDE